MDLGVTGYKFYHFCLVREKSLANTRKCTDLLLLCLFLAEKLHLDSTS